MFLKVNISFLIKMIFSDLGYITYHCSAVAFPISPTMVKISFSAFMTLLNSTPSIWPPSNPVHYIRIKFEVLKNVPSDFTQDILLQPNKFLPDHGDRQEPTAIRYIIVYIMESRGPAETKRKLNMQVKQICGIFY